MKKIMMAALLTALLVLPMEGVVLAQTPEAIPSPPEAVQELDYTPGSAPAETGALDSIAPALHGVVLAMLHQEEGSFAQADSVARWEALYNTLSLYGQMDDRADCSEEELLLPTETVSDFSAALADFDELGALPEELSDRMVYDAEQDSYILTCGSDGLAQVRMDGIYTADGGLEVSGALVYLVDGSDLADFRATLQPRDNLFGYAVTDLELI